MHHAKEQQKQNVIYTCCVVQKCLNVELWQSKWWGKRVWVKAAPLSLRVCMVDYETYFGKPGAPADGREPTLKFSECVRVLEWWW